MTNQNNSVKRYRAINWIRVLAFLFIIVYHFMREIEVHGNYSFVDKGVVYFSNSNIHIAIIGVSLFFMISGGGLMLSSQRKWDIKHFYIHRFAKILIPFYVVYIFTLVASFAIKQEWVANFSNIPLYRVVFTVFGVDSYFAQFFPTFGIHIGEWFLGALVMLYALFPAFRFCMEKNRYITIIVATLYYIIINATNIISISPWTSVFVKAYDFILGMFLILEVPKILEKKPLKYILGASSLIVIVLGIIVNIELPTPTTVNNLIYAVAIYVFLFSLEDVGKRDGVFDKIINNICSISYEIFLVHHIIIFYIGDNLAREEFGVGRVIALFITELIIMVGLAFFVKNTVKLLSSIIKNMNVWEK